MAVHSRGKASGELHSVGERGHREAQQRLHLFLTELVQPPRWFSSVCAESHVESGTSSFLCRRRG